jgi:hypothetical protein
MLNCGRLLIGPRQLPTAAQAAEAGRSRPSRRLAVVPLVADKGPVNGKAVPDVQCCAIRGRLRLRCSPLISGWRYRRSSMVFVFCQRVHDGAVKADIPEPQLLGNILAHELGHEVLGDSSHSKSGIMKAVLQPDDFAMAQKGLLRFTKAQVRQLRAEIQ